MESLSENFISQLNEYQQKNQVSVKFEEGSAEGPSHNMRFTMRVIVDGKEFPYGCGKNKKEAKQNAAKNAVEGLKDLLGAESVSVAAGNTTSVGLGSAVESISTDVKFSHLNYTCWLNEYSQKNKLPFTAQQSTRMANQIHSSLEMPPSFTDDSRSSTPDVNYTACVNEFCQERGFVYEFKLVEKRGPSHIPEVVLNEKEYPEGTGKNKKEAKQMAAQQAWMEICDSKNEAIKSVDLLNSSNNSSDFISFRDSAAVSPSVAIASVKDFSDISTIGKGGFGRVFQARHNMDNKCYAVKIVKYTEKACREVDALADFNHTNIVRYFTSWVEDTAYKCLESYSDSGSATGSKFLYIQMELCEGDTLHAWICEKNDSKKSCLTDQRTEAAHITLQVLKAVESIHSKGLIHRDLKPLNIMFSIDGTVKVGDFGLVTSAENESEGQLLERTRHTGTRSYMSPEQATQTDYNEKVDIYALGLIYFELIWRFFTEQEKQEKWHEVRRRDFPAEFNKKFSFEHKHIERMLSECPEHRPQASELIGELDHHYTLLQQPTSASLDLKPNIV
ncbi:hypothetical protein DNTS_012935 [Danionella cerebrum]|uniref:non-specific serine/threonine protein kinase n=1 Tax=Danionella cerebrum TaxID=2873325 RepID=A0A553NWN1_9TELE|nr:hypothetical protein DNTS_012935 [Danionella translucida]